MNNHKFKELLRDLQQVCREELGDIGLTTIGYFEHTNVTSKALKEYHIAMIKVQQIIEQKKREFKYDN